MEENPLRETVARSVITAAERGDRLAFISAAERFGSIDEAQELVRENATLRMVDRVTGPLPTQNFPAVEYRDAQVDGQGDGSTLYGHFTVWNQWYEVNSFFEGNFLERTVPGSTTKTIAENQDNMRALFQHGMDPMVGDKPLGPIVDLREDKVGAYYEVDLLRSADGTYVGYVDSIVPGLRAGLYGASFRFRVTREEFDYEPTASDQNPDGLPERTIKEMQVVEFGPVTFPANPAASAALRSSQAETAPVEDDADAEAHPDAEEVRAEPERHLVTAPRRGSSDLVSPYRLNTKKGTPTWLLL